MNEKKPRFRKLVNPKFQLRFALSCLVPMLMMSTIFWITLEVFINRMINLGKSQGLPANHEFFQLVHAQRVELLQILIIFSLALTVLFFIWGLLYSHRIAGPLLKLTIWLNETKDLNQAVSNPVQFRKNDIFQDIPEAVNKFVNKVNEENTDEVHSKKIGKII